MSIDGRLVIYSREQIFDVLFSLARRRRRHKPFVDARSAHRLVSRLMFRSSDRPPPSPLSSDSPETATMVHLERVRNNASNRRCADCNADCPTVAILSWLLIVCEKCAGE